MNRAFALLFSVVFLAPVVHANELTPGQLAWKKGLEKLSAQPTPEVRVKSFRLPATPDNVARHKGCEDMLIRAFKNALTSGYSTAGRLEYFEIEIATPERPTFVATYTFVNGAPGLFTVARLPEPWRLVALSVRSLAGSVHIITDPSVGCSFQLDTIDPFASFGSITPPAAAW
jgi:hypothetical protein